MNTPPPFDPAKAHRVFSAECFNRTWKLLDQAERSPADDEAMLHLAHASLWHWTQRDDCTTQHLSVGYWLLARAYAVTNQGHDATRYANRCLEVSQGLPPFYLGYAHEAAARAAILNGDTDHAAKHRAEAQQLAAQVSDAQERSLLEKDLAEL